MLLVLVCVVDVGACWCVLVVFGVCWWWRCVLVLLVLVCVGDVGVECMFVLVCAGAFMCCRC